MATSKYSALTFTGNAVTLTGFNPVTDTFTFDGLAQGFSAADIFSLSQSGSDTVLTFNSAGGPAITFTGLALNKIDQTKFIFADGSQLIVGDGLGVTTLLPTPADTASKSTTVFGTDADDYILGLATASPTVSNTASYAKASSAVTVSLANNNTATDTFGAGKDKLINIQNLTGSIFNDTLAGDGNANVLDGGAGADNMNGGAGDDTYIVTPGDVIVDGAIGDATGTTSGTDLVQSAFDYSLAAATNVENLTLTGATAVAGTGNGLVNSITGNSAGNILDGGAGQDTLTGLAGNDTYLIDNTNDTIVETSTGGTDTAISTATTYTLPTASNVSNGYVENLRLIKGVVSANTGNNNIDITGTGNTLDNTIIGSRANDALNGGDGKDTLTDTLGGNDTLTGGNGVDNLNAGKGNDILNGGVDATTKDGVADTLTGGAGNDTYNVTETIDVVNEALSGGTDTVNSTITYTLTANVDNLNLTGLATSAGTSAATDNISGTGNALDNTIIGNAGINTLNGMEGGDTIGKADLSGVNNDILIGGTGTDTVNGGAGNDTLVGGAATTAGSGVNLVVTTTADSALDTMKGGAGNDTYYVTESNISSGTETRDTVVEASGNGTTDTVSSSVNYTLTANVENLTLTGTGNITGTGNAANDATAGSGSNTITGNVGNNTLSGLGGADILNGMDGNDTLDGGTGNDSMAGGAGNDTYVVDGTNMSGTTVTLGSGDTITEASAAGTDLVNASVSYGLSANVDNLTLTSGNTDNGTGNAIANIITGNGVANTLTGLDSADILNGGAGDDTLIGGNTSISGGSGGAGAVGVAGSALFNAAITSVVDTLNGGAGKDTYVIDSVTDIVNEQVSDGGIGTNSDNPASTTTVDTSLDTVFLNITLGAGTYTLPADVENLMLGGSTGTVGTALSTTNLLNGTGNVSANSITGNDGANTLIGGAGVDTLTGGDGADTLIGGNSLTSGDGVNDTLIGGAGNDKYYVTEAGDIAREETGTVVTSEQTTTISPALDTVFATLASGATYTINDSRIENLTLQGTAISSGLGNASANILTGNTAVNTLNGGAGNDKIDGGLGADVMIGGAGDDLFIVDNTADKVSELSGTVGGTDTVQASVTYTINDSDVENLTLTGASSINAIGNGSANTLTGNSGVNTLSGSGGDDTLDGGAGKDTLTGGNDNDKFVLGAVASSADTITDFETATIDPITSVVTTTDVIDLSNAMTATAELTIGTEIAHADGTAASTGDITTAADTAAPVYWIDNTNSLTLAQIEAAIKAGSAATGETVVLVDSGVNTSVYYDVDADVGTDGTGLILLGTLSGITGASSFTTGDFISA
jgi:Ca2+-binding RTX toxin-like protein